ncbi:hypothetical protein [Gordonia sp. (in: high G+C Gram-positive bacteria)]|uniref:hypothetical protein n=1 Tax=Gordonia sp. (in: high G+C Gram-positive bacteria) TaxID=84139 RepID=UPI00257E1C90|nr:hypothetical protein [Gordonia sp. (in: high G+C Gram-positive bacteria)]
MSSVERAVADRWVPLPSEVRAVVEGRPQDVASGVDLWWRDAMPPAVEAQIL